MQCRNFLYSRGSCSLLQHFKVQHGQGFDTFDWWHYSRLMRLNMFKPPKHGCTGLSPVVYIKKTSISTNQNWSKCEKGKLRNMRYLKALARLTISEDIYRPARPSACLCIPEVQAGRKVGKQRSTEQYKWWVKKQNFGKTLAILWQRGKTFDLHWSSPFYWWTLTNLSTGMADASHRGSSDAEQVSWSPGKRLILVPPIQWRMSWY